MDVILDRLAGRLGRGCEKRTDIDVKAQVGECRSNNFLAAVVPVLPNLGDKQTRAAAGGRLKNINNPAGNVNKSFNNRADTFNGAGHADLPLVDSCNRLDLGAVAAEYLFQRQ
jgi:hypothetical protein